MSEVDDSMADFWAQLVCITDTETPPHMIGKDKFTIGRANGCDVCHENNRLISSTHCYILRDENGKVWLYDSSTNGTLLNSKTRITKGECREIVHGDEFYIVHKKGEDDLNIGYVFQDLVKLKEEEKGEESDGLDQTLEYEAEAPPFVDSTIADDRLNIADEEEQQPCPKRRLDQTEAAGPDGKRARTDTNTSDADSTSAADDAPPTATAAAIKDSSAISSTTRTATDSSGNDAKEEKKDVTEKEATDSAAATSAESADTKKDERERKGGEPNKKEEKDDAFAETLTCIICQELLHDCISLQPCMHSFCAGCYSEWMEHSSECPSCRTGVDRINKNHIVNNLVEAYLNEHPDKRRPEEDIKELNAKNQITRDMLYPKRKRRDSSDYSDSDLDNSDDHYDPDPVPFALPPAPTGMVFGFGTPVFGTTSNAFRAVCRQCPGSNLSSASPGNFIGKAFIAVKNLITGTPATAASTTTITDTLSTSDTATITTNNDNNTDQPSTSGAGSSDGGGDAVDRDQKVMPTPPAFQCAPNQNHVLCQCCLQIFPDRRLERNLNPALPPQQCAICYRAFCHAYWGCRKVDCNGCLAKFKDMKFGKKVLAGLILDNPYESEILKNYLESKGLAVQDVLDACLAKMQEGTYTCPDQARYNMNGDTPLCYPCALRNFKALAYQYRYDIPRGDLPAEVTARPDCYWGKNCRTQRNKPPHSQRFNHICNQTRT